MTTKKEKCKELVGSLFGPVSAKVVDNMLGSDEEIIAAWRLKVEALFGEEKAKEFDELNN